MLFARLLSSFVRYGDLTIIDAKGRSRRLGGATITDIATKHIPPAVTVRIGSRRSERRMTLHPDLAIGEAYMDGTLVLDAPATIYDFLAIILYNLERAGEAAPRLLRIERRFQKAFRWAFQFNTQRASKRNVAHHYDLSKGLYDLFLDDDKQYSCAYFPTGTETLDEAQTAKKRHIAAKLALQPGHRVLDIGCGWGGMALYLAHQHDVSVQGITLSQEQLAVAQSRAEADDLSDKVLFELRDYRDLHGSFDRIVSVGMFEHVGAQNFGKFFRQVKSLLAEDGVALLHTIGRFSPPGGTNAWLRKYIFPGGYTPALSEIMRTIEKSGLIVTDVEVLRTHYAETIRHWRTRFLARRSEAAALYDERFCRMWEFYLAGCELVFRFQDQVVFQIQLCKRRDALPETRDYIHRCEMRHSLRAVGGVLNEQPHSLYPVQNDG